MLHCIILLLLPKDEAPQNDPQMIKQIYRSLFSHGRGFVNHENRWPDLGAVERSFGHAAGHSIP